MIRPAQCANLVKFIAKNSFFQISPKVKLLELSVSLSANINMLIAVILSTKLTLRTQQKPRYRILRYCEGRVYVRPIVVACGDPKY